MEINNIICRLAKEVRDSNNGVNDWNKVKHLVFLETGMHKSTDSLRKIVKRYTKRFLGELPEEVVEKVVKHTKEVIELKEDGSTISEKMIKLSQSDLKSRDFLLTAHGFNPNEFELLSATNNFWGNELYQSKIKVRSLSDKGELSLEDIKRVNSELKPIEWNIKLKPFFYEGEKFALELDIFDPHIGGLSWREETGEDNDYKLTMERFDNILAQVRDIIFNSPIEKLFLIFGGDFFQIDGEDMKTVKGTKVDFDTRPYKMLQNGRKLIMKIIETLAIVPTEVIWVEGNHSKNLEFAVFDSMPYIYAHAKHITFNVTPRARKAFVYGGNLVGIHHGEMNKANAHGWLQNEFRKEWGEATYSETHSGHIHHESVIEKNGIINRSNPTSKPLDKYEYQEGYISNKATLCYLWSKEKALKAIYYIR